MSWAEEDWTVGLSGRVLQKVKELQVQQERLSRENKQKQLQLDNLYASHEKQTVKYEEVRVELHSIQRELLSVQDEAKAAVTSRDRLAQDLQTKQAQVCSLEGQLDSARTINNKLTQEVKRLEAELEKLQNSYRSADSTVYSTPCWNTPSPWEHNGRSRREERTGQQDEGQSRALHIRQRLQFSDMPTASLPRQQYKSTPQTDSFSTPLSVFPWERDESRSTARRQSPSSPQTPLTRVPIQGQLEEGVCGNENDPRTETNKSLSEIRSHVSSLEEELSVKESKLKATQGELAQYKKELATKEGNLQKSQTRIAQETERASGAEQRLKQVQEELKCQRQNAESSRLQHQQRIKELEKQHQKDLMEFQNERQCLVKQHQQEINKLNQELQQARTLYNTLQAQADKLSLQKQALEKELDALKEKVKWTEKQLQESLKKEAQTQAKLMEVMREAEGVVVSLEQSKKRERALEEEGKRLAEELADALRLIRELQELQQKTTVPLQPVQICFSPQPSYSLHSGPSNYTTRSTPAPQAEWKREKDVNKRKLDISASYPADREPGEGIDSEHISVSTDSESLQKGEHTRIKCNAEENKSRTNIMQCENSETSNQYVSDCVTSTSSNHASDTITSRDDHYELRLSSEKTPLLMSDPSKASEDFKRENAMLQSELHDIREELKKRLEDLEVQRRAEAETRTRLKQLSRKHAAQVVDKEEQDKVWKAQLESEKTETERLRKAMAALQMEMKKNREEKEKEREEQEEVKSKAIEEKESEMIALNIQLKKQLAEVKAQLALEREEQSRKEEEMHQMTIKEKELKKEFSMKMAELKAELEKIHCSRKEDLLEDDRVSSANSPLTYLTLHDDEFNSNIVYCDDNKCLNQSVQQLLLCRSTNQHNALVTHTTAEVIKEDPTDLEHSPLSTEGQLGQMASVLIDTQPSHMDSSSISDHQKAEVVPLNLTIVVERLEKENAKEKERANLYQVKLEALQSQVTHQTQQLTMAFESQSQHISGLLAELRDKESALLSQGEELQHYKQELNALKPKKGQHKREKSEVIKEVEDEDQNKEREDENSVENSGVQPNQEKEYAFTLANDNLTAQKEAGQPKTVAADAETPSSEESGEAQSLGSQHSSFIDSEKTQSSNDSACVMGESEWIQNGRMADVVAELLALQQQNQLLKKRIETLTVSDVSKPALHALSKNQEDPGKQSHTMENLAHSCLVDDIINENKESVVQNKRSMEDGEMEDTITTWTEEGSEEVSQLQINQLKQQVVALQMKVQALSEQNQEQADELVLWRLASQPAPTFKHILSDTDKLSEPQNQFSVATDSNQQHPDDNNQAQKQLLGSQGGIGKMTVTREDELFLSCSSHKLQGCMLVTRLQHCDLPEPNIHSPSTKTSALQQCSQDTGNIEESEKENQPSKTCPSQDTERSDLKPNQISFENMDQQQIFKDHLKVSVPYKTKSTEGQTVIQEVNPIISRKINEIKTIDDSSKIVFTTKMKNVSSQTEDILFKASELHAASTQTEEEKEDVQIEDSPPVSSLSLFEKAEPGTKVLFSGSFPIPADPARLAERIRRNRTQMSAAYDDTEYEPYGLPEVVMKGFADIPSGPSCPYIVRRGLLGTTVVPASQKDEGGGEGEEETD